MINEKDFIGWIDCEKKFRNISNFMDKNNYSTKIISSAKRYKISFSPKELCGSYKPFSIDTRFVDEKGLPCSLDSVVDIYVIALDESGYYIDSTTIHDISHLSKVVFTMINSYISDLTDAVYDRLSGEVVF